MPNLLIVSDNELFKQDLIVQIGLYAPQFNINLDNEIADIVIIDEKQELISEYIKKFSHAPILVLLAKGIEKPQETDLIKYRQKPLSLNISFFYKTIITSIINMLNTQIAQSPLASSTRFC